MDQVHGVVHGLAVGEMYRSLKNDVHRKVKIRNRRIVVVYLLVWDLSLKIEAYYNPTLSVIHSYKSDHPSIPINLDNCLCSHLSKTKKTRLGYQELITSQNNFRQSMKTQQWPTFAVTVGALLSWILDWSCDMETPDFRCAVWSGVTSSSGLSLPSESLSSP